jgi:hypothetical protein
MSRMQRTQVYLEPELSEALDHLARQRGTTRSDLLRLAARRWLAEQQPIEADPIFELFGIGSGDGEPVAERHHEYLVEAEQRRRTQ